MKKAEYIHSIATQVADKTLDLETMKTWDATDRIINELDAIRGIGVWTAELTVLRGMRKLDAMPADDLGLRRCIAHYYCSDKKISSAEARSIAAAWGKWKGLVSYYLIIAELLEIEL
jgi:DNA-3-methyladenine glycosylase II